MRGRVRLQKRGKNITLLKVQGGSFLVRQIWTEGVIDVMESTVCLSLLQINAGKVKFTLCDGDRSAGRHIGKCFLEEFFGFFRLMRQVKHGFLLP